VVVGRLLKEPRAPSQLFFFHWISQAPHPVLWRSAEGCVPETTKQTK